MTTVKMRKEGLVTNVYNDPKTIADAQKKGFRLVDATDTETAGETESAPADTGELLPTDEEPTGTVADVPEDEETPKEQPPAGVPRRGVKK